MFWNVRRILYTPVSMSMAWIPSGVYGYFAMQGVKCMYNTKPIKKKYWVYPKYRWYARAFCKYIRNNIHMPFSFHLCDCFDLVEFYVRNFLTFRIREDFWILVVNKTSLIMLSKLIFLTTANIYSNTAKTFPHIAHRNFIGSYARSVQYLCKMKKSLKKKWKNNVMHFIFSILVVHYSVLL